MALFLLGAGATRGCSFVDPRNNPCLPPLDKDFFTQLQRVQNKKHWKLIQDVMQDVVEIFGPNFDVTMENVFTTYEHAIRMLDTTGGNRAFKKGELQEKKKRLVQAIAVVLEDSLAEKDDRRSRSRLNAKECDHHNKFVEQTLSSQDDIITFNYDCVLDFALKNYGSHKWNARYGYGFNLGGRGALITGDDYWQPQSTADRQNTIHYYKLHGSLHFDVKKPNTSNSEIKLKERPYTRQRGDMRFTIIPPEWHKAYDKGIFAKLWKEAATAIHRAKNIVIIGYSVPVTDLHSTVLLMTNVSNKALKSLIVVNPDREARKRTRTILQRGLDKTTKVFSFDKFEHFLATPRTVWDV